MSENSPQALLTFPEYTDENWKAERAKARLENKPNFWYNKTFYTVNHHESSLRRYDHVTNGVLNHGVGEYRDSIGPVYKWYYHGKELLVCYDLNLYDGFAHGVVSFQANRQSSPAIIARYYHGLYHGLFSYAPHHNRFNKAWLNLGVDKNYVVLDQKPRKTWYFMNRICRDEANFMERCQDYRADVGARIFELTGLFVSVASVIGNYVM